jgi:heme a synthase
MNPAAPSLSSPPRAVRWWLFVVAALVFVMVLVGGATRLTESGLSIVEWRPITGVLPPLTETEWQEEFAKYQATPQYRMVNRGMSLADFKTIYWWEWVHRLLGRVIGAAFLFPFLFFLWRGWIGPGLRGRLWAIFGLGALQGVVGWWMVASGLSERVDVSQYRLATHLTLACVIYVAVLWTAAGLGPRIPSQAPFRLRAGALVLVGLVIIQIYLGALVAGLDAGLTYNTWPTIEGQFIPPLDELFPAAPWWRQLFENRLTVQFDHRMAGYALWIVAVLHAVDAMRASRSAGAWAVALAAAVTIQAALGILTLLLLVPLGLALTHQGMAMVVLTMATIHAARLRKTRLLAPVAHGESGGSARTTGRLEVASGLPLARK